MKLGIHLLFLVLAPLAVLDAEETPEEIERKLWSPSAVVQAMKDNLGQAEAIVLVVDVSPSMKDTLAEMGKEFERLHSLIAESGGSYTPMGLITFGKKPKVVERPTKNYPKIAAALGRVDPSISGGKECPMAAVRLALESFAPKLERLVIFLVYDEAGDDQDSLEETIELCRQKKATVHLIGRDAAFGRCLWSWQQQEGEGASRIVSLMEAKLGSEMPQDSMIYESRFLQRIWDPDGRGLDFCISSGYSPWALSRLAHETAGVFFPLKAGVSKVAYAHEARRSILAGYRPSLEPREAVLEALGKHQLGRFTQSTMAAVEKITWPTMVFKGVQDPEDMTMRLNKCLTGISKAALEVDVILEAHLKGRSAYRESLLRARADWELAGASLMVIRYHLESLKEQVAAWLKDPAILRYQGRVVIIPAVMGIAIDSHRASSEPDFLGEADPGIDMTNRFLENMNQIVGKPCPDAVSMKARADKALELVGSNHKDTPWAAMARMIKKSMGGYFIKPLNPAIKGKDVTNRFQ